jgi:putative membrane protein
MMNGWYDGYTWWWMIAMMLVMIAVVGAVVWVLVYASRVEPPSGRQPPSAEAVLAQRFAAGEIDTVEYHERLDALHGKVRQSS